MLSGSLYAFAFVWAESLCNASSVSQELTPSTMLCENCQQSALDDGSPIFQVETDDSGHSSVVTDKNAEIPTKYFLRDRFPGLPNLRKSAHSGCEFCSFLRESILSNDVANCLQSHYRLHITSLDEEEITLQIRYLWNLATNQSAPEWAVVNKHFLKVIATFVNTNIKFSIFCNIGAVDKEGSIAKWLRLDGQSDRAFASTNTIRWIKTHISNCQKHNHELPTPKFVPRLLLDVRGKIPKLVDQDALICGLKTRMQLKVQTPRYAALSYCWGSAEDAKVQLTTTRSTLAQRRTGVDTREITPVLRDAISITKRLSIPYLWIDSLCILQDDIVDWNQQCADMDKIYGHAEITIAAASSASCREGFIQQSAPGIQLPFHSALIQGLHGSIWIELREVKANIDVPPSSDIHADVGGSGSRLATRGWAVQERVLSQREIVFGRLNVHFICPWQSQSNGGSVSPSSYHTTIHPARAERKVQELYSHWANILRQFNYLTADSFTCATDLLPSVSGMAADFAKRLKDDYFAGHWGDDLVMGLMWSRDGSFRASKSVHLSRIRSPIQYLVPSWSQLSHFGAILTLRENWSVRSYHSAVEYIGAHTTLKDENNAFGAISNGELRICGYSMNLRTTGVIRFKSTDETFENWADQIFQCRLTFELYAGEDLFCDVRLDYDLLITDIQEEVELWKWILLGTCKCPPRLARTEEKEDDEYPFGLLVHSIRGSEWCRIGVFEPAWRKPGGSRLSLRAFQLAGKVEDITII